MCVCVCVCVRACTRVCVIRTRYQSDTEAFSCSFSTNNVSKDFQLVHCLPIDHEHFLSIHCAFDTTPLPKVIQCFDV